MRTQENGTYGEADVGHLQKFEVFHNERGEDGERERSVDREVFGKVTAVLCAGSLQEEQNRSFWALHAKGESPDVRVHYIRNTRTGRCFFPDGRAVRVKERR